MQREATIYAVYTFLSAALCVYATFLAFSAWQRFGFSGTFAVLSCIALLIAVLALLFAALTFVFRARSLVSVRRVTHGFELLPSSHSTRTPIQTRRLRHIRTIGKQFAKDESAPAFAILAAEGGVWVAEASSYQAANASATP